MSSDSKVVLFDIDKTLLQTDLLRVRILKLITLHSNLSLYEVEKKLKSYLKTLKSNYHFDFLVFLEVLSLPKGEYELIKNEFEKNSYIFPKFDDVIPALESLWQKGHKIGIFSEGVPRYQRTKLKNLKIDKYLNSDLVFIVQKKRTAKVLKKLPKDSYIIDDNIDVILYLEKWGTFNPVLLNRNNSKDYQTNTKTIQSLLEVKDIL